MANFGPRVSKLIEDYSFEGKQLNELAKVKELVYTFVGDNLLGKTIPRLNPSTKDPEISKNMQLMIIECNKALYLATLNSNWVLTKAIPEFLEDAYEEYGVRIE